MSNDVLVRIDGNAIEQLLDTYLPKLTKELAMLVVENAKSNIEANNQVDTGFLRESLYYATSAESTYDNAMMQASIYNVSTKSDRIVSHDKQIADEMKPEPYSAVVSSAANYAIYQEADRPFLFPALEYVQQQLQELARKIFMDTEGEDDDR